MHVRDAVEAILRAALEEGAANNVFNVAGPEVVTYDTVGRFTRNAIGQATREDLVPDNSRLWGRYVQQYDISAGKKYLGFKPSVSIYEGMAEIIEAAQADGVLPRRHDQIGQVSLLTQPGEGGLALARNPLAGDPEHFSSSRRKIAAPNKLPEPPGSR